MDPYEAEEEQGLVGAGRINHHAPSSYSLPHDQHPKVQTLTEKAHSLSPGGLLPQKSGQIRSQQSDIAVLYASDDEVQGSKGPRL